MRQHALSLSLGSRFGGGGRNGGASPFDGLELDFEADSGTMAGASQLNSTSLLTVTRALAAYADDTAGVWTSFGVNTARRTNKGLLVEEARTNGIRNNAAGGSANGSPGTLPTNWGSALNGVSQEVVGTGTENGLDYIDLRFFGTTSTSSAFQVRVELNNNIVAANGQTWTGSLFYKLAAGSLTNISTLLLQVFENDAAGATLASSSSNFTPTSTMQRITHTRVFNQATTAFANLKFSVTNTNGVAIDITIRIYMPQLEQGAFVTSPIRTTAAAVTRPRDVITIGSFGSWFNASEGTMYAEGAPYTGTLGTSAWFQIDDASTNNRYVIGLPGVGAVSAPATATLSGGASQQGTNRTSILGTNRTALAYKVNDFAASVNGEAAVLDTSGALPVAPSAARIGEQLAITTCAYIKHIGYARTRLTDAVIAALTFIAPTLNFNFVNDTATVAGTLTSSTSPLTVSRASTGYAESSAGVWTSFGNNVARRTDKGLLVEEARTNGIRNNSMQGAVANVSMPTNWGFTGSGGITTSVVALGTENGVDYIDIRWVGTSTGTVNRHAFDLNSVIVASVGQNWTHSMFCKLVSGDLQSLNTQIEVREFNAGVALTQSGTAFTPGSTLARVLHTRTLTDATVTHIQPTLRLAFVNGLTYDFTLRIGWPQAELGAFVTSPIRTTAGAATRAADAVSMPVSTNWFSQLTGSGFIEATTPPSAGANSRLWVFDDGTANNRILTHYSGNAMLFLVTTAGAAQASINGGAWAASTTKKAAAGWIANDYAHYFDGAQVGVDAAGTIPAVTTLQLGQSAAGIMFGGYLRGFRYYAARLPNTLLQALTI
jgi:hypothetical protein